MRKFNIGDRVKCIQVYQKGIFPGECGTVIDYDYRGRVGVELDNYNDRRHELSGRVKRGHGWWVLESCLEPEYCMCDFGELPMLDITSIL